MKKNAKKARLIVVLEVHSGISFLSITITVVSLSSCVVCIPYHTLLL